MRPKQIIGRGVTLAAIALAAPLAGALTFAPFSQEAQAAGSQQAQETGGDELPTLDDAQALLATDPAAAVVAFGKIAAADPTNGQAVFMHAYSLHMTGDLDAAHDRHLDAAKFPQFAAVANYNHACIHAMRGEKDVAFRAIAEARAAGFDNLQQLLTDPDMEKLRDDGRYKALILEMQPEGTYQGTPLSNLAALPAERRFDFYIGEWDMALDDVVERRLSVERAFDDGGLATVSRDMPSGVISAQSLLVYQADKETWKQIWVQRDGTALTLEGGLVDDALVLAVTGDSEWSNGRSVFKGVTADAFVYEWQETIDDGTTWETRATRSFKRR